MRKKIQNYPNSLFLPGTVGNSYAEAVNADMVIGTQSYWIATWLKCGNPPLNQANGNDWSIAGFDQDSSQYWLLYFTNGNMRLDMTTPSANSFAGFNSNNSGNFYGLSSEFVRLFLVCDSVAHTVTLYVNGISMGTQSAPAWNLLNSTNTLGIGEFRFQSHAANLRGYYNDFQYGVGAAPSAQDAVNDYYYGIVAPGCKHRWLFNETSGSIANDSVGTTQMTVTGGSFQSVQTAAKPRIAINSLRKAIGQSQNLYTQSQSFSNAVWNKINTAPVDNAVTAPDGTTTASAIVSTSTANTQHALYCPEPGNIGIGQMASFSVFAKAGVVSFLLLDFDNLADNVFFSLSGAGSYMISGGGQVITANITNVGNGWYRCVVTFVKAFSGVTEAGFYTAIGLTGGSSTYASSDLVNAQVYLWGAQYNSANWAPPYTATTTTAVTAGIRNISINRVKD